MQSRVRTLEHPLTSRNLPFIIHRMHVVRIREIFCQFLQIRVTVVEIILLGLRWPAAKASNRRCWHWSASVYTTPSGRTDTAIPCGKGCSRKLSRHRTTNMALTRKPTFHSQSLLCAQHPYGSLRPSGKFWSSAATTWRSIQRGEGLPQTAPLRAVPPLEPSRIVLAHLNNLIDSAGVGN